MHPRYIHDSVVRIMETDRSLLGESRTSFMEDEYEYANEFGKQGRKNPTNIPKFTINHQRFCCAIDRTPTHNRPELCGNVLRMRNSTMRRAVY